jgi:pSer/pThr/pTyr-binding forkhead associated (FHA) protein
VSLCSSCGRDNKAGALFCLDCGKPLGNAVALERARAVSGPVGTPVPAAGATLARVSVKRRSDLRLTLVLLDETGHEVERFERATVDTTVGRGDGDLRFPDDPFLSPLHARLSWEGQGLVLRDLGSRNGTWVFLQTPHRLLEGDLLLIGSQVIRFRCVGHSAPPPHPSDADATQRMGSLVPSADSASLTQLRSDGSARDVLHLTAGRDVFIGRERGDWVFPYDPSLSAQHALIRSEGADFVVLDLNSRNGVGLAVRGDVVLGQGSRILAGDKLLQVELPS